MDSVKLPRLEPYLTYSNKVSKVGILHTDMRFMRYKVNRGLTETYAFQSIGSTGISL
jgi:hypothetical protein